MMRCFDNKPMTAWGPALATRTASAENICMTASQTPTLLQLVDSTYTTPATPNPTLY